MYPAPAVHWGPTPLNLLTLTSPSKAAPVSPHLWRSFSQHWHPSKLAAPAVPHLMGSQNQHQPSSKAAPTLGGRVGQSFLPACLEWSQPGPADSQARDQHHPPGCPQKSWLGLSASWPGAQPHSPVCLQQSRPNHNRRAHTEHTENTQEHLALMTRADCTTEPHRTLST